MCGQISKGQQAIHDVTANTEGATGVTWRRKPLYSCFNTDGCVLAAGTFPYSFYTNCSCMQLCDHSLPHGVTDQVPPATHQLNTHSLTSVRHVSQCCGNTART
jgi:hypothetical protein